MPSWPRATAWPAATTWPAVSPWPAYGSLPAPTEGVDFRAFFTGVLQAVQPHLGLVYGGTLKAAGTTPPVITLTGALSGQKVPIRVTCPTTGGARGTWVGSVSYDGGTTQAQSFLSGATVALTGAGSGLTLNIAAGTAATDNVWLATASQLTDLSGTAHYTQATAAAQPTVTKGLGGRVGISSDGTTQYMGCTLDLPAPGTTPTFIWSVCRILVAPAGIGMLFTDQNASPVCTFCNAASADIAFYNGGATAPVVVAGVNNWGRLEASYTNSVADRIKFGAAVGAPPATNVGNSDPVAGRGIFATNLGVAKLSAELLALIYLNNTPTAPQLAAAAAAVTLEYGASVGV